MRTLVCVATIALISCGGEGQPGAVPGAEAAARERPTEVAMVASMEAHYGAVILAHDALLQGDLDAFRRQLESATAQALPTGSPPEWLALHEPLDLAAREGTRVADLDEAAVALASVVLACGRCHAALDTGPVYPAPAPGEGHTPLRDAMRGHQWATARLWEGVTGPWDNAWQRGASALAEVEIFGEGDRTTNYSDTLRSREQQLRDIGSEAMAATPLDERAAVYGRLLSTCGACHQAVGVSFLKSG